MSLKADNLCIRFLMADVSGSSPLTSIPFVFFSSLSLSFGREGFFFIKKIFYENEKERLSQSKNK